MADVERQASGRPLTARHTVRRLGVVAVPLVLAIVLFAPATLGTFLLARALGLRRAPALLGGVAFGFGTYLIVWLSHPHANAYVVLPWLFLFAERLCRSGRVRDAGALAAAVGVAGLSGQP